jgi:hypothetical protein
MSNELQNVNLSMGSDWSDWYLSFQFESPKKYSFDNPANKIRASLLYIKLIGQCCSVSKLWLFGPFMNDVMLSESFKLCNK